MNDDDSSDWSDTESIDSCEAYINFESIRLNKVEKAICFSWPGIYQDKDENNGNNNDNGDSQDKKLRKLVISTLLEEEDLAPLFDGSRWAGTRLWGAAVRAIQYMDSTNTHLPDNASISDHGINISPKEDSLLELGCGLGVPGMIYHLLGGDVVLTDQADILSQLEKNVVDNFNPSAIGNDGEEQNKIRAMPLSWSRTDISALLEQLGKSSTGFDIVLNCDCVYEPLYGLSWHLLNETIDELLKVNPKCVVVSSMERRAADGIDNFLEEMRNMDHVGSVERVWVDEGRKIEIYLTRGIL